MPEAAQLDEELEGEDIELVEGLASQVYTSLFGGNKEENTTLDSAAKEQRRDWFGNETLVFTVTDSGNLSANDSALFQVVGVNDPRIITGIENQTILEGEFFSTISLDACVDDVDDGDADLSWNVSGWSNLSVVLINHFRKFIFILINILIYFN